MNQQSFGNERNPSNYRNLNGIHFIRVHGSNIERARAHVALLKKEVLRGAVIALARKNEWLIRRAAIVRRLPVLQELILKIYNKGLIPKLSAQLTQEEKDALVAISAESGLPYETWLETLFQTDALMLLVRATLAKHFLPEWIPGGLPGCSSAVALNQWTQSGRLLTCRNFDYFIVGPWEENQTVVFNEPSEKDHIPFVSLTTAGVQIAGVTAINREGLTLATHAHFGNQVSLRGRSIVLLGDEVIRKSKRLGQAIDLLRKNSTCANWSFVMSSAKENAAVVVEMAPDKVSVHEPEDGFLSHTNYFHDPKLRANEALLCGAYYEDLGARICQLRRQLEVHRGKLEPSHMSVLLGNHYDALAEQERVVGNTVSVVTTVQSAVFDPGAQKFWMANRQESPVGLAPYMEVDMERFWKQTPEEYAESMESLPHWKPKSPQILDAIHHYRAGYRSYHTNSHEPDFKDKTLVHLKKAIEAYPADAHLWIQAGILSFTLRKFDDARHLFEESLSRPTSGHVTAVRDLYLARCYDVAGRRSDALDLYRKHGEIQEPKLRKAFRAGARRPYKKFQTFSVQVDLQFADTLSY